MRGTKHRWCIILEVSDDSASTNERLLHWCFPAIQQIGVGLYKLMSFYYNQHYCSIQHSSVIYETHYTNYASSRESVSCNLLAWMHIYIAMTLFQSVLLSPPPDLVVVSYLMQFSLIKICGKDLQFDWIFCHYSSLIRGELVTACLQQVDIDHFFVKRTQCYIFLGTYR